MVGYGKGKVGFCGVVYCEATAMLRKEKQWQCYESKRSGLVKQRSAERGWAAAQ